MKNIYLIILLNFFSLHAFSAILTVSNDPSRVAKFSSLSSAHSAANVGDTIYVYGSPNNYPLLTLSKQLVIIGPGYNPNSSNTNTAKILGINLNNGSSNSTFIGICFVGDITGSNVVAVNNVTIRRCTLASVYIYNTNSNWLIENCIINFNLYPMLGFSSIPLTVRNNLIGGAINGGLSNGITSSNAFSITNNLFVSPYIQSTFFNVRRSLILNNIFYGLSPNGTNADSNVFMNNICWDINNGLQTLPYGTNVGFSNQVVNPFFMGAIDKNLTNFNNNFRLNANSLARFAGTDSTDIGPTGGASPIYASSGQLTGMPPIPSITQMSLPVSATPQGGSIQLFIRGRKNN